MIRLNFTYEDLNLPHYYDMNGDAQDLDEGLASMTAAQLTTRKGAVKWLNDNADEKGHMNWVRGRTCPELSPFGTPYAAGMVILVR